jgi:hypothetical protein
LPPPPITLIKNGSSKSEYDCILSKHAYTKKISAKETW